MFRRIPIPNNKTIRRIFLNRIGFLPLTAKGIATPKINKKAGKTRSAKVKPFQLACTNHHADPFNAPK